MKTKYHFSVPDPKRVRMIVHTDCKNEADDQFALVHHLLTPKFIVKGIVAGHFDLGGKMYVLPTMFAAAEITDNLFTFAAGDVIVKGEAPVTGQTPATLKKAYEMCTVLGVTDNRRAPNAPHLRITGA